LRHNLILNVSSPIITSLYHLCAVEKSLWNKLVNLGLCLY